MTALADTSGRVVRRRTVYVARPGTSPPAPTPGPTPLWRFALVGLGPLGALGLLAAITALARQVGG